MFEKQKIGGYSRIFTAVILTIIVYICSITVVYADPLSMGAAGAISYSGMSASGIGIAGIPSTETFGSLGQQVGPAIVEDMLGEVQIRKGTGYHSGVSTSDVYLVPKTIDSFQQKILDDISELGIVAHSQGTLYNNYACYNDKYYFSEVLTVSGNDYWVCKMAILSLGPSFSPDGVGIVSFEGIDDQGRYKWKMVSGSNVTFTTDGYYLIQVRKNSQTVSTVDCYAYHPSTGRFDGNGINHFDGSLYEPLAYAVTYQADNIDVEEDTKLKITLPTSLLSSIESGDYDTDDSDLGLLWAVFESLTPTDIVETGWDDVVPPEPSPTDPPAPTPVPPYPPDTIGGAPVDDLWDNFDIITGKQDDAQDSLDDIDLHITEQTSVLDGQLTGVQSGIESVIGKLQQIWQAIRDGFDSIIEKIETANISLFGSSFTPFLAVFGGLFTRLKGFLGIWHYVVEWFQSISSPFAFFRQTANSISYNLILPIYASIAGIIVIAVYKRFGK